MKYSRDKFTYIYSKWFHHMGTMRVIKKKSNGEIRLVSSEERYGDVHTITDSHALDVFIWLGRYLAQKGKLPRHLRLDEIAIQANRTSKDIRSVVALEVFDKEKGDEK